MNPNLYSHKFKSAGLRYEVGVHMKLSKIVWINGGVPCGANSDLGIANSALVPILQRANEKAIADGTYRNDVFLTKLKRESPTGHVRQFNKLISQVLARHETLNRRLKNFSVLSSTFRHGDTLQRRIELHNQCFIAVANLTQLNMCTEPIMVSRFV